MRWGCDWRCVGMQSVADTMQIVQQAMKSNTTQMLKLDSDDFIDDAIDMDQQEQRRHRAPGRSSWSG